MAGAIATVPIGVCSPIRGCYRRRLLGGGQVRKTAKMWWEPALSI